VSSRTKLNVGLIGLGRLGRVYARDLATRVPSVRLTAVADVDAAAVDKTARELGVERSFTDASEMFRHPSVDAVVIVTPTSSHKAMVEGAAAAGKAIFCEKPPSISLDEAVAIRRVVEQSGVFFQMGFQRRFDRGFVAAKKHLDEGAIGDCVVFKSTSRDPYRPSIEYADPRTSGGLIIDMGIHDCDIARWYMGDVVAVQAVGGLLAYPELGSVGDIDNAVISLIFASGRLGVIDITRNGIYGYDINAELLGTKGTLRVGYLRETPLMVMTKGQVAHDTVPFFMERFGEAYTAQLDNFAHNVLENREPPITVDDGVEALRVAIAATRAQKTGERIAVASVVEGQAVV
jgi:scyllo-inositol 2-dehydrogenase (NAD+)